MIFPLLVISSVIIALVAGQATLQNDLKRPWMSSSISSRERAQLLLKEMTLDEKVVMLHGNTNAGSPYVGFVPGNERLGIPPLNLNDGPQGFRDDQRPGTSTCWPSTLTMAATFDRDVIFDWGKHMALEFYQKGANVLLGPGLNVARVPTNGRNFEYLSGGDPYLGYSLVKPLIRGMQSLPMIANAKHYIHNNQETDRGDYSANVDENTRFDIYYQPFLGAIEADVGSFMCSYNKIYDVYSCENNMTLNTELRGHLNYQDGFVMSDWGATHSTSIKQGLDQEMPSNDFLNNEKLQAQLDSGEITMDTIDTSVLRILTPMFQQKLFDTFTTKDSNNINNNVTSVEHNLLARKYAVESTILLKNSHDVLPLQLTSLNNTKIALFGSNAVNSIIAGGGSGHVVPYYIISPVQALAEALDIDIPYTTVNRHVLKNNRNSNNNEKVAISKLAVPAIQENQWYCNTMTNNCIAYNAGSIDQLDAAVSLKNSADYALVSITQYTTEGIDRGSLSYNSEQYSDSDKIPKNQDDLIQTLAASNNNNNNNKFTPIIVSALAPGATLLPWKDDVDAILYAMMPGQEYGHALVDVLFNLPYNHNNNEKKGHSIDFYSYNSNPAGRLPLTLPNRDNEVNFTPEQYPGVNLEANYDEMEYIDYRYYQYKQITPAYAFGFGLSYTTFTYSNLVIQKASSDVSLVYMVNHGRNNVLVKVTISVTNSGKYVGREVPQLYIQFPSASTTNRIWELKGFDKTRTLTTGEADEVTFTLSAHELAKWDISNKQFQVVRGKYQVAVGAASNDLRLFTSFTI